MFFLGVHVPISRVALCVKQGLWMKYFKYWFRLNRCTKVDRLNKLLMLVLTDIMKSFKSFLVLFRN